MHDWNRADCVDAHTQTRESSFMLHIQITTAENNQIYETIYRNTDGTKLDSLLSLSFVSSEWMVLASNSCNIMELD